MKPETPLYYLIKQEGVVGKIPANILVINIVYLMAVFQYKFSLPSHWTKQFDDRCVHLLHALPSSHAALNVTGISWEILRGHWQHALSIKINKSSLLAACLSVC